MSTLATRSRLLGIAAVCLGLTLPALGFDVAIAQASALPAPADDPAPAPDPSAIVSQANTILPIIGQFAQYLPGILDPGAALQDPGGSSVLQPQMLNPYAPGS